MGTPWGSPDMGCTKAKTMGYQGKCIECPLVQCLEDNPHIIRDNLIKTMFHDGVGVKVLALQYHLGVHRIRQIVRSE